MFATDVKGWNNKINLFKDNQSPYLSTEYVCLSTVAAPVTQIMSVWAVPCPSRRRAPPSFPCSPALRCLRPAPVPLVFSALPWGALPSATWLADSGTIPAEDSWLIRRPWRRYDLQYCRNSNHVFSFFQLVAGRCKIREISQSIVFTTFSNHNYISHILKRSQSVALSVSSAHKL